MKIRTTIAVFILTLSPAMAFAYGCNGASKATQESASMSCVPGTTFDAAANTCVADVTG